MALLRPMSKAFLVLPFVLAACEVGEVPMNPGTGIDAPTSTGVDGSTPTADAPVAAATCVPRLVPPNQAHVHSAGATTHAGENCIQGGCHLATNVGVGAPGFQFGGTLYGNDGSTPNKGATITFTGSAGGIKQVTTDDAGNFYLEAGQLPMAFPAKTSASVCATGSTTTPPQAMSAALANTDGACARSGCHTPGAGQGAIKLDPTN